MLFHYKALDTTGNRRTGNIDAVNMEIAISSLQRRGFVISSIAPADEKPLFERDIRLFERITNKDLVILSRQISTLFEAQVSALRIFKMLAAEAPKPILRKRLTLVADDIQGGSSITNALEKHSDVFSSFYINMVRAGEEAGKLDETFLFLADYLERTYEVTMKARNALVYPSFVVAVFIGVMILVLTVVIPQISVILEETEQEIPFYTKIVIGLSDFLVHFWPFILALLVAALGILFQYSRSEEGKYVFSQFKVTIPYIGDLYRKLYLSRIADTFSTMLASGVPMVRTIDLTAVVVDNKIYEDLLRASSDAVRGGSTVSSALGQYPEIPGVMVQMIKVGEETGEMGNILKVLARFYSREVNNAVDNLVGMIEPVMIIALGVGVGTLLASVLIPIYNIAASI